MKHIDITRLPGISFAHTYSAAQYSCEFPAESREIEVAYLTEGELLLQKGGAEYLAGPGDVLCIVHDAPARVCAAAPHAHHTVCARVDWVESASENALRLPPLLRDEQGLADIRRRIDDLIRHPYRYEGCAARGGAAFLSILSAIDEIGRRDPRQSSEGELLVRRAKRYIFANLERPITQREIADHLGITPQYLCNIFRRAEGQTLIKYVNAAKLRAIEMLMDRERAKLCDAARQYGYSDPNYVSSLYKRTFGHNITERPGRSGMDLDNGI